MGTFSDLPRYPPDSIDGPDEASDPDGAIRGAVAIAQVVAELLLIALPLFACLWWVLALPVLLALIVATSARDERH